MNTFRTTETVGSVVTRRPALSRVFEQVSIDYCCGGKKTLEEACQEKEIELPSLIASLEEAVQSGEKKEETYPAAMSLSELADHIVKTHHVYLRNEFPRLDRLTKKVASVHGKTDPRLCRVRDTYKALEEELTSHMMKEERILFPMIRQLDSSIEAPMFHCGSLADTIRQMEKEHDQAGSALGLLRELTDGYTPPEWACNTYRVLLDTLDNLERDLHKHIHKENNVLFPRALEMEESKDTTHERDETPMCEAE